MALQRVAVRTCIFKQERKEAVPIVEPEERLENICKAERERWMNTTLTGLILTVVYLFEFWKMNFEKWAFSHWMLSVLFIITLLAAAFLLVLVLGIREGQLNIIWMIGIMVGGIGVISLVEAFWRPLAEENVIFQILIVCLLMFVGVGLAMGGVIQKTEGDLEKIPLVQADYREIDGNLEGFFEQTRSVLGEAYHGDVTYSETETLSYEVYHSPYQWVIAKTWERICRKQDYLTDCKDLWNAREAYQRGKDGVYWYYVKYPEYVVRIYVATN